VAHQPLSGQTVEVQDDSIRGQQAVKFTPEDEGVNVVLTLEYEINQRSVLTPLVDLLFIKRAFRTSLEGTLQRFGLALESTREAGVG
jgi:hypothetical protein